MKRKTSSRKNPVAKYGVRVNRAAVHKDKKKAQRRGASRHRRALELE